MLKKDKHKWRKKNILFTSRSCSRVLIFNDNDCNDVNNGSRFASGIVTVADKLCEGLKGWCIELMYGLCGGYS